MPLNWMADWVTRLAGWKSPSRISSSKGCMNPVGSPADCQSSQQSQPCIEASIPISRLRTQLFEIYLPGMWKGGLHRYVAFGLKFRLQKTNLSRDCALGCASRDVLCQVQRTDYRTQTKNCLWQGFGYRWSGSLETGYEEPFAPAPCQGFGILANQTLPPHLGSWAGATNFVGFQVEEWKGDRAGGV